jgi:hypothetical protein
MSKNIHNFPEPVSAISASRREQLVWLERNNPADYARVLALLPEKDKTAVLNDVERARGFSIPTRG